MIVIGFQGIGKSTIALNRDNTIDLEAGNFFVDGERDANWYKPYCNIAISLSEQLNTVFVSSHKEVRQYLDVFGCDELIAVCYPVLKLQDEWIEMLYKRQLRTGSAKDRRAYFGAVAQYTSNILDLMNAPFIQIPIKSMNYRLENLIAEYEP